MAWRLPSTTCLAHFYRKLNWLKTPEKSTPETSPSRGLSTLDLTLLGVGGMVGVGLYVLTGTVARQIVGPAVLVSYMVAAVAALLAALCYAEFGARVPGPGSAYLFTYVSMGELWAFVIGWNVLLECLIGGAAVAQACSGYLDSMFDYQIRYLTETHISTWQVPFLAPYPDFLASGIILLASAFLSCGARISSWLNHTFTVIKLCVILFIVTMGFSLASLENWSTEEGGFAPFGFSGIMAGTAICFIAFEGFSAITASNKKARNPRKAVPMAIAISLGLVATAYTLVSTVLTLMVPWHSLNPVSALADAFYQRGYSWAGFIVAVGSICGMITALHSILFFLPRLVYAMAADGLFFQVFARVHPRTQVPMVGTLVIGVLMALLALVLDLYALVQFISFGALLDYTFMAASTIRLRFQKTSPPRSLGLARPGPEANSSVPLQPVSDEHASGPEPGQLRPALRPYLGFLGECSQGTAVAWALSLLVTSAIALSGVLIFGDLALHLPRWGYILLALLSGVTFLLSLAVLAAHQQEHLQDTFQVPLVPLTPALSILLNICLMLNLRYLPWLYLFIWLLIGLAVYFSYGIWHSKENLQEPQEQASMHAPYGVAQCSLEEMVQAVQPPAQEPDCMEQHIRP
ncbi:cationic amino acid transporter 4-like [Dasypus novemcinctus]|uniref:cationic amino acid transporter 4-like n=1 Tax=Dasypus novemcinctus TaxID=9361 RepID=UPI00265E8CD7|nr:cationic amino acid transporter 4-like [Dasypus novemcinctus]